MRMIGQFQDEGQAKQLGEFLYGRGINNQVDRARTSGWEIWILDEHRIDEAAAYLKQFVQYPDDPLFAAEAQAAAEQRRRQEASEAPTRTRLIDARAAFYRPPIPYGVLTITLIAISVVVFLITKQGDAIRAMRPLLITEYLTSDRIVLWQSLPEVFSSGQVWRLFTPMFIHFGIIHILFNMWMLFDLGNIIEARRGKVRFVALVLVISGVSNVAQYVVSGPMFGGMSGVLYGLLCYMWMQGKFNPASDLSLNPQVVTYMIVWFFLCLVGIIPHVANTAHAAGAVVGGIWGYLGARWATRRRD